MGGVRRLGVRAARAEMWDEWDRWDEWECEPKPANAWSWVCGGDCGTSGTSGRIFLFLWFIICNL